MKFCKKCSLTLSNKKFKVLKTGNLYTYCNECTKAYDRSRWSAKYSRNKEKIKLYQENYRITHVVEIKKRSKLQNTKRARVKIEWIKNKYKNNKEFRAIMKIRQALRRSLRFSGLAKIKKTEKLLGYSSKQLYRHLSKFLNKPCTGCDLVILREEPRNYHIEHIIPLCIARNIKQVIKLNQFKNLRLWCENCNSKKVKQDKEFKKRRMEQR